MSALSLRGRLLIPQILIVLLFNFLSVEELL
jgi:hypothetical protein